MNLKQTISLFCLLVGINNGLSAMLESSLAHVQALEESISTLDQRLDCLEQVTGDLPKTMDSSNQNDKKAQDAEEAAKTAERFKDQRSKDLQDKVEALNTAANRSKEKVEDLKTKLYLIYASTGVLIGLLTYDLVKARGISSVFKLIYELEISPWTWEDR